MILINDFLGKILLYISIVLVNNNRNFKLKLLEIEKIIIDKNSFKKPINQILLKALICIEDKRFQSNE